MPLKFVSTCAGALALAGLLASAALAETIESATTPFNVDKCSHRRGREVEDYGEWRCAGYAGIPVVMTAGDIRVYVSYGAKARNEPAAGQTLAAPNGEGKRIEWRMTRDANTKPNSTPKPFATIMHWTTAVVDDTRPDGVYRGEVLVVTRLGPGAVCHVGYVDGRQNANADALAREIADQHARTFRCGEDKPIVLGDKGPGFSQPYEGKD